MVVMKHVESPLMRPGLPLPCPSPGARERGFTRGIVLRSPGLAEVHRPVGPGTEIRNSPLSQGWERG